MLVDSAMIDKLVSNQAFIKELMAQKGWYYETYQAQQLSEEREEKLNENI